MNLRETITEFNKLGQRPNTAHNMRRYLFPIMWAAGLKIDDYDNVENIVESQVSGICIVYLRAASGEKYKHEVPQWIIDSPQPMEAAILYSLDKQREQMYREHQTILMKTTMPLANETDDHLMAIWLQQGGTVTGEIHQKNLMPALRALANALQSPSKS